MIVVVFNQDTNITTQFGGPQPVTIFNEYSNLKYSANANLQHECPEYANMQQSCFLAVLWNNNPSSLNAKLCYLIVNVKLYSLTRKWTKVKDSTGSLPLTCEHITNLQRHVVLRSLLAAVYFTFLIADYFNVALFPPGTASLRARRPRSEDLSENRTNR